MVSVRPKFEGYLDEYYGLSTDDKPVYDSVVNGSTFVEIDTWKQYYYDKGHKIWHERTDITGEGSASGNGGIETEIIALNTTVEGSFIYYIIPMMPDDLFDLCNRKRVLLEFTPEEGNSEYSAIIIWHRGEAESSVDGTSDYYYFEVCSTYLFESFDSGVYPMTGEQYNPGGSDDEIDPPAE